MDFTLLILVLLVVAFLLRIDFIFYIIYVCVGVYAWSRWVTPRIMERIKVEREYADHAFWGERVPIRVHLRNTSIIPLPWINVQDSVAPNLSVGQDMNQVVALGIRGTAVFTYEVAARRRGYYRIGPLRLVTSDLFGLYRERRGQFPAQYLTVYPRITPLTHLGLPSRLPFGVIASNQRLFEDPARPIGVREFRSGDSLRHINWKVSAHTRNLVVKTYQPAISLETAILLNLHRNDYETASHHHRVEWAIEVAASLAAHLVNRRQPVGLITNGIDPLSVAGAGFDKESGRLLYAETSGNGRTTNLPPSIPPRPGRAHLMKVLARLARIESDHTTPLTQWADGACSLLSWGVTVLVITPRGDEATCQTLHRLVRAGLNPVLIAVEPDYNFGQVRERARRLGFAAYHVTTAGDMDQWRRPVASWAS